MKTVACLSQHMWHVSGVQSTGQIREATEGLVGMVVNQPGVVNPAPSLLGLVVVPDVVQLPCLVGMSGLGEVEIGLAYVYTMPFSYTLMRQNMWPVINVFMPQGSESAPVIVFLVCMIKIQAVWPCLLVWPAKLGTSTGQRHSSEWMLKEERNYLVIWDLSI